MVSVIEEQAVISNPQRQDATKSRPKQKKTAKACQRTKRTQSTQQWLARAEVLLREEVDFVPNAFFKKKSAVRFFAQEQLDIEEFTADLPEDDSDRLPTHMTRLCNTPLLSPEQETAFFRRMNYAKFKLHQCRGRLDLDQLDTELIQAAEEFREESQRLRDIIIRANLRLVVSVTRKFVTTQLTFDELFSDGVLALMNAVEKFDYDRGYRFSTYAYYSISRSLYRLIKAQRRNRLHSDTLDQTLAAEETAGPGLTQETWDFMSRELRDMLQHLDRRERWIIQQRYTLENDGKAPTYKVLAEKLGICNERVRQLEKRALQKLRQLSEDGRFNDVLDALDVEA